MKKYVLLAILPLVACSKVAEVATVSSGLEKTYLEFNTSTEKTTLDGNSVIWEEGDAISLFDGSANNLFVTAGKGASVAFTGYASSSDRYTALYPYQESASMSGDGSVSAELPDEQTLRPDGFPEGANLSLAVTDNNSLRMMNVCGYLKFALQKSTFTKIQLKSGGSEKIAGPVDIAMDVNGLPQASPADDAVSSVTLLPEGKTFAAGIYYAVLLPQALSKGVTLMFTDTDGTVFTKSLPYVPFVQRAVPLNIGTVDSDLAVYDRSIKLDPSCKTTLTPGLTSTVITLKTMCSDVEATLMAGSTLNDVKVTKASATTFNVEFTNSSDDPQVFNTATIRFSATDADPLDVTLKQGGCLFIDFSSNLYSIPGSEPSDELSFNVTTAADHSYTIRTRHCYWHSSNHFIFKGGTASPWGYVAFPALEGLKLTRIVVVACWGGNSNIKTFDAKVMNYDQSDSKVYASGITFYVSADEPEKIADFTIEDAENNVSYMLYRPWNNNGFLKSITLSYE